MKDYGFSGHLDVPPEFDRYMAAILTCKTMSFEVKVKRLSRNGFTAGRRDLVTDL